MKPNEITVQNPLMQPINYEGGVYFTSQYFHQMYGNNGGGKYKELFNFNKLIRSIEAYPLYVLGGDIVELTGTETDSNLESVCKATRRNPIMLINATAQVALTHHLDDELSKQVSVNVNEQAASRESQGKIDFRNIAEALNILDVNESRREKLFDSFMSKVLLDQPVGTTLPKKSKECPITRYIRKNSPVNMSRIGAQYQYIPKETRKEVIDGLVEEGLVDVRVERVSQRGVEATRLYWVG
jgi:hypothetical protein